MKARVEILNVVKDKKKYIVTTNNDEYRFDEATIINFLIMKGKSYSEEEFKEILKSEETTSLLNKALKYLSFQMRSEAEVRDYLKEKEASEKQIEEIIEKLKYYGYLDDLNYAQNVLDYMVRNGKGPKALASKLIEKKIPDKIKNEVIAQYSYDNEYDNALNLAKEMVKKNTDKPIKKQKQIIYEKLLRNGFSMEISNRVINHLEYVDESEETLVQEMEKLITKYQNMDSYTRKTKIITSLMSKGYDYSQITKKFNE